MTRVLGAQTRNIVFFFFLSKSALTVGRISLLFGIPIELRAGSV
jgi:hypothetical protein